MDAANSHGWRDLDNLSNDLGVLVRSVGWLVMETREFYVLAQSLTSVNTCAERMEIPKRWIKSIKKLHGHSL